MFNGQRTGNLATIGVWAAAHPEFEHDELKGEVVNWIRSNLGYETVGEDLRIELRKESGRPDIQCLDSKGRVIAVFEIKIPADRISENRVKLEKDRLRKYLEDSSIRTRFVALTDGARFYLYRNMAGILSLEMTLDDLRSIGDQEEAKVIALLAKPHITIVSRDGLEQYFLTTNPFPLDNEANVQKLVGRLELSDFSDFGSLVTATLKLFDFCENKYAFFDSAFEFWKQTFYREIKVVSAPSSWKRMYERAYHAKEMGKLDLQKFEFCLETAYSILSRMILAKACEDYQFPHLRVSRFVLERIATVRGRDEIPPVAYGIVINELMNSLREGFVSSLFELDIFDWWVDAFAALKNTPSSELVLVSDERTKFAEGLAEALLMLYVFDFSGVKYDLLGRLYQSYFEKETRRALGEFYTPMAIAEYILDMVGYVPSKREILHERLIDPACGSGTFLIEALGRWLRAASEAKKTQKDLDWKTLLEELCIDARVVGLDIHPFACFMAQMNFLFHILPYYSEVVRTIDKSFVLRRIPIFRTDSLYDETRSQIVTAKGKRIELQPEQTKLLVSMPAEQNTVRFEIKLPIKYDDKGFVKARFEVPARHFVRTDLGLDDSEYFKALQAVFDAVKKMAEDENLEATLNRILESSYEEGSGEDELARFERTIDCAYRKCSEDKEAIDQLEANLHESLTYYFKREIARKVISSLEVYAAKILLTAKYLKYRFKDGRLIKAIEDRVLSVLLKHYFEYEYVVANPPYVSFKVSGGDKLHYASVYYSAKRGKWDLYCPFIEKGLRIAKERGRLGFICSDQFMIRDYGENLKQLVLFGFEEKGRHASFKLEQVLDFKASGAFTDVTNYPCILILEKDFNKNFGSNQIKCVRVSEPLRGKINDRQEDFTLQDIKSNILKSRHSCSAYDVFEYPQGQLSKHFWKLMPSSEREVVAAVEAASDLRLGQITKDEENEGINQGAITKGADGIYFVYKVRDTSEKLMEVLPLRFMSDRPQYFELEKAILKPLLKGEDVRRWKISSRGLYLIYPYKTESNQGEPLSPSELETHYRRVWNYLCQFKTELQEKTYKDDLKLKSRKREFYELWRPRDPKIFEQPKILVAAQSNRNNFAFDAHDNFYFVGGGSGVYSITLNRAMRRSLLPTESTSKTNHLYLLGLLNSRVLEFYFKHYGSIKSAKYYQYMTEYLQELPIVQPRTRRQESLARQIVTDVEKLVDIGQLSFPWDYCEEMKKARNMTGEIVIDLKDAQLSFKMVEETLKLDLQRDLEQRIRLRIDRRNSLVLPSELHVRYFETYVCENGERAKDKISVSRDAILDMPLPVRTSDIERALTKYSRNAQTMAECESRLNDNVMRLYGLDNLRTGPLEAKDVIDGFLSRW